MKRYQCSSLSHPNKKRKLEVSKCIFNNIPYEIIFHIIKYIDNRTDINKFIYSITFLKEIFSDDDIWRNMLYQNLKDPIINETILWQDDYYNNLDISVKYNLQIVSLCQPKSDYYIISLNNESINCILNMVELFNKSLLKWQNKIYNNYDNKEYLDKYIKDDPMTKLIFIDRIVLDKDENNVNEHRVIISNEPEDIKFIEIFDIINTIIEKSYYEKTNYYNKLCIYSNILTIDDIRAFIVYVYGLNILLNGISPMFRYEYKDSVVIGVQFEMTS